MAITNKQVSGIGRKEQDSANDKRNKIIVGIIGLTLIASGSAWYLYTQYKANQYALEAAKIEATNEEATEEDPNENAKVAINLNPQDKEEQYSLGIRYIKGDGIAKNYEIGIRWLTASATQEHLTAQGMLGNIYYYGEITKPDFKKALMWNTLAAAQGLKDAQFILGLMYEQGQGVERDRKESQKWFELAAAQGMKEAQDRIIVEEPVKVEKSTEPNLGPKLVTKDDLNEVNKYLATVKKNKIQQAPKEREIIWNGNN